MRTSTATTVSISAAAAALALASTPCPAQEPPAPRVDSPEIGPDRDVTLRLRAPAAEAVELMSPGDLPGVAPGEGLPMGRRGDGGAFEVALESVPPGSYRYIFDVDGVAVLDPGNPRTSESNRNVWSLLHVEGSEFMDVRRVPHGAVAEVHYHSSELGRHRRMHVYTPPGYARGDGEYPVFYLLHGAMDSDDSWTSVGRAGSILDNLIASGDAVPMVVVMPDGHQGAFTMGRSELAIEDFAREFAADVKPYVEANYRVREGRSAMAIAGLSMGGAHTLEIAFDALEEYGYVGVFSSGVLGEDADSEWRGRHAEALDDASLRRGLELVWFSTGRDDFVLETTERTVALLRDHGFEVEFDESAGGHTWINWREYLNAFAPRLFH